MTTRTPEHNAKIAAALRGRKATDEHRRNMSLGRAGLYRGAENSNWRDAGWADHPKEKARIYNAAVHARKHGRVSTLTLAEWLDVLAEYGYRCAYCFGPFEQLDHVRAIAFGGENTRDNVVPSCAQCNKQKTNRKGRAAGWVPSIASRFWPSLPEELYA